MTELATIARPYARACFEVSEERDLDMWSSSLEKLSEITRIPEIARIVSNPRISPLQIFNLLTDLVESNHSLEFKNFIRILVYEHRLMLIEEILVQFNALKKNKSGELDVEIRTPFPMRSSDLDNLIDFLQLKFSHRICPKVFIDSSLIGGVTIKVGDKFLDASVRYHLKKMERALVS